MHFFVASLLSIAVIAENYVRHVRNLRPMNRLIYYTHSHTHTHTHTIKLRYVCVNARYHCRLTPPFLRRTSMNIGISLVTQKLESLLNICVADSTQLVCILESSKYWRKNNLT